MRATPKRTVHCQYRREEEPTRSKQDKNCQEEQEQEKAHREKVGEQRLSTLNTSMQHKMDREKGMQRSFLLHLINADNLPPEGNSLPQ
jgi:hypothetical protein